MSAARGARPGDPRRTTARLAAAVALLAAGCTAGAGGGAGTGDHRSGDAIVRAFAAAGWAWGGDWHTARDYQHFSASGR